MGDMPCVWCLLFINAPAYPGAVMAFDPGQDYKGATGMPVRSWAEAEEFTYGTPLVIRDQNGVRCGLTAQTLVSGSACCYGHAMHHMKVLVGAPTT